MAVLRHDGTDDWTRGNGIGAWNGTFTAAVLINSGDPGGNANIFGTHTASAIGWELYSTSGEQIRWWNQATSQDSIGPSINNTDDFILVVGRTTGTSTPRFHLQNLTTAAAMAHSNGSAGTANPGSASGQYFKAGAIDNTPGDPGSGDEHWPGDMGLLAFWDGVNLSDAQAEELGANSQTSDWYNNSGGTPMVLAELNTLTPTDIGTAGISLAVTGCALTGTDPVGWTFDATGADPPLVTRPDADTTTTGWTTTPLFSKLNDESDGTVITATLA